MPQSTMTFTVLAAALMVAQPQQLRLRDYLRLEGTQLDLRGTVAADDDLQGLARDEFRSVTSALLASTRVGDDGLKHLGNLRLIQLDLGRTNVTSAGLEHLGGLPIERLELTGTAVDDRGLAHLRSMPLKVLVLRDTKVTGVGLDAIAGDDLKLLDLAFTRVSDESLARLAKVKRLETLILSETGVTDRGLQHIGRIPGLNGVDLAGTAVTQAAVDEFRRAHPGIHVNTKRPVRSTLVDGHRCSGCKRPGNPSPDPVSRCSYAVQYWGHRRMGTLHLA